MSRTDFYVYILFRHDTGEPFYVGKGNRERLSATLRPDPKNTHKTSIILKAKKIGKDIPQVLIASNISNHGAIEIEKAFISAIGREPIGPLVNMTDGGEGMTGHKQSEETLFKKSIAMKGKNLGRKHSAEEIEKIRQKNCGRKHSKETLMKMRAAQKGRIITTSTREKLREFRRGRVQSEETKAKISKALIGNQRWKGRCRRENNANS